MTTTAEFGLEKMLAKRPGDSRTRWFRSPVVPFQNFVWGVDTHPLYRMKSHFPRRDGAETDSFRALTERSWAITIAAKAQESDFRSYSRGACV
jgi:hypothetical protein